jgi:Putative addiction module component
MSSKTVLAQALKLPKAQRIKIAHELFESALDEEVLAAGAKLAEERWQAYLRGEIGAKPIADVIERLKRRKGAKKP